MTEKEEKMFFFFYRRRVRSGAAYSVSELELELELDYFFSFSFCIVLWSRSVLSSFCCATVSLCCSRLPPSLSRSLLHPPPPFPVVWFFLVLFGVFLLWSDSIWFELLILYSRVECGDGLSKRSDAMEKGRVGEGGSE